MWVALAPAGQGELALAVGVPVERSLQPVAAQQVPALAHPQGGVTIATGLHELGVLVIAHRPAGQRMGADQHAVPRRLAVEREAGRVRPGRRAHLHDRLVTRDPAQRGMLARGFGQVVAIRRPQWIAEKGMLDVGQQQLLVLLLMLGSQLQHLRQRRIQPARLQGIAHARIDLLAVVQHLRKAGP